MQWFICYFFNKLPFKHLFEYLHGETTGPASFSGNSSIINFEAIELDEISINKTDLSNDQQYLLDIVIAIQTGQCAPDLAVRDPGSLSPSKWFTCAIRVLCFFISQTSPKSELKMLVNYIMKTYAPVWFVIKRQLSVKYGPEHRKIAFYNLKYHNELIC
ncbi:hypothetical protein AVEN_17058-1 [Araneus ventricosus]|uniref:Uncharacterized protein n=1 Tax=Araneus ventricosus TaxID=182803 RepID=A0A4Y2H940_ARAVE|nr:hypothetical protein AVEN_17058-1 [Araneus ventricosus]